MPKIQFPVSNTLYPGQDTHLVHMTQRKQKGREGCSRKITASNKQTLKVREKEKIAVNEIAHAIITYVNHSHDVTFVIREKQTNNLHNTTYIVLITGYICKPYNTRFQFVNIDD